MIPVNKRKIGICVLLSIVTFGIYQIYWEYLLVKNTRAIQKDDSSCTGEMLCLVFVPFYSLFWWFTRGKIVKDKFAEHGYSAIGNEIAYLILSIFCLAIVSMAIMQNDFNSLRSESTQSIQRSTVEKKYGEKHPESLCDDPVPGEEQMKGSAAATADASDGGKDGTADV